MPTRSIRTASADDLEHLRDIEIEADSLFGAEFPSAIWPPAQEGSVRARLGTILVASESPNSQPFGFAHIITVVENGAHLEQISVSPTVARRGHGRALVEAAKCEAALRGCSWMTLRTFSDVPWNAPFYATCGFVESEPDTEFLHDLVRVEEGLGLLHIGRRIQMSCELQARAPQ